MIEDIVVYSLFATIFVGVGVMWYWGHKVIAEFHESLCETAEKQRSWRGLGE